MQERKNILSWDETFMGIASLVRLRSKDPRTQVGACIVNDEHRILSIGYNGSPNGIPDKDFPWGRDDKNSLKTKYPFVIHAERNAILNFRGNLSEFSKATLYVTHFPCNECAKELLQVGISSIFYLKNIEKTSETIEASKFMFEKAGVKYKQIENKNYIQVDLTNFL